MKHIAILSLLAAMLSGCYYYGDGYRHEYRGYYDGHGYYHDGHGYNGGYRGYGDHGQ